jgi:hypothetical protein
MATTEIDLADLVPGMVVNVTIWAGDIHDVVAAVSGWNDGGGRDIYFVNSRAIGWYTSTITVDIPVPIS